jgi:DNA-directed RNA polymerase subunit RPC12/RpoP
VRGEIGGKTLEAVRPGGAEETEDEREREREREREGELVKCPRCGGRVVAGRGCSGSLLVRRVRVGAARARLLSESSRNDEQS